MGYYTNYQLEMILPNDFEASRESVINDLRSESEAEWALDEDGNTSDSVKWYSHEKDLVKFSQKWDRVLFILHGAGEENTAECLDIWKLYVKNGKAHRVQANIHWPHFDPKDLGWEPT